MQTTKAALAAKAKVAMANRTRVTFGKAYIRDVIAGVQRDFDKQVCHAVALGIGPRSRLKKMKPEALRERLVDAIIVQKKSVPRTVSFH